MKDKDNILPYFASIVYAIIWTVLLICYWVLFYNKANSDWYGLMSYWIILPVATLVVSVFYGRSKSKVKWFSIPLGSILLMLFENFTFGNFDSSKYMWILLLVGFGASTIGMVIGHLIMTFND